jgi:ketosteroid isomerase-like protein
VFAAYAAMNEREYDRVLRGMDPEVEWVSPPEFPDAGDARGTEAVRRVWVEQVAPFDTFHYEVLAFEERGRRTVVSLRLSAYGKESGAPVEMAWHQVAFYDDEGLVLRLENYLDEKMARRAFERQ